MGLLQLHLRMSNTIYSLSCNDLLVLNCRHSLVSKAKLLGESTVLPEINIKTHESYAILKSNPMLTKDNSRIIFAINE